MVIIKQEFPPSFLGDLIREMGVISMGKKHRNRINSPKKNNHIAAEEIVAEHEAHAKEHTAQKRKR